MKSNNVFVWIEYRKTVLVPKEVEDWMISQLNKPNSNVAVKDQSYFLRTNLDFCSFENRYSFHIYTGGWQNLPYRIYLEINHNEKTGLHPLRDSPDIHQKIDNYDLALLTLRDPCFINGHSFRLIRNYHTSSPTFQDTLMFTAIK